MVSLIFSCFLNRHLPTRSKTHVSIHEFHAGAAAPTDSGSSMHLFGFTWLPKSVPSHCRRFEMAKQKSTVLAQEQNRTLRLVAYINEPLLCNAGIMMYIFIIFRVKNSPIQRGTMHRV